MTEAAHYSRTRIKDVAEARGIRLPWLAGQMGYSRTYLHMVLNGRRRITPQFVQAACRVMALPASVLFYNPED
jgi:hypothetical protein